MKRSTKRKPAPPPLAKAVEELRLHIRGLILEAIELDRAARPFREPPAIIPDRGPVEQVVTVQNFGDFRRAFLAGDIKL